MNAHILVVEDNVDLAENLAELFRDEGAQVVLCTTAEQAETWVQGHHFDLIAVDIRLGSESGLDLIPRLRDHNGECEVILVTGNASLDSAIEAIGRGVFAYVQKPFVPDQILTLARRALAQVSLRREKRTLAARLEASEALYRDVVETVEACILGVDREGTVRFANRHTSECAGRDLSAVIGSPFAHLWHPAGDTEDLDAYFARTLGGESLRDIEHTLERPDGSLRTIRWSLACLGPSTQRREDPLAAVVLAVGLDVTERVELERRDAENQALAAMGTLTTGLAHEIRNPLNAAKLQLELLVRRASRAPDRPTASLITEPAEIVRGEIERLSTLLNEFLQLAHPRPMEKRPIAISRLFADVIELQAPVADAARVTLRAHVHPESLTVRGDYARLKQVLINLVTNAVDAMRDQGTGTIELTAQQGVRGEVYLYVRDEGPGIAPELAAEAFQPFVTSKEAGTGLGLAIVKTIVERHRGRVTLRAGERDGTVAEIVLPANTARTSPPAAPAAPAAG